MIKNKVLNIKIIFIQIHFLPDAEKRNSDFTIYSVWVNGI